MESITEVVPGIFQLKVPLPDNHLGFTLSYLLKGTEGHFLIDTGIPAPVARDALFEQLRSLTDPREIAIIAITHSHADHAGLVGELKGIAPQAMVAMHHKDWNDNGLFTAHRGREHGDGFRERMFAWGVRHGFPAENTEEMAHRTRGPWGPHRGDGDDHEQIRPMEKPEFLLEGGERLSNGTFSIETIHTPGHSPGHLCYYEPAIKVMFTGDHVLPVITSNVSIRPGSETSPLEDYLASLTNVAQREVEVVCPAHEYVFYDLPGRVAELHQHHEARLEAVLRTIGDGTKTGYEIAAGVPWDVGSWEGMNLWLRRSALGETLAHLEVLITQDKVQRCQDGETISFEAVRP